MKNKDIIQELYQIIALIDYYKEEKSIVPTLSENICRILVLDSLNKEKMELEKTLIQKGENIYGL